jgi:hypothetical protein
MAILARWLRALVPAALLLVLAVGQDPGVAAQGSAPLLPDGVLEELEVQYVGSTPEADAYAAVVDRGFGSVAVYLCDGADLGLWLTGTRDAEGHFVANGPDGSTAEGTIDGARATGSIRLADGTELPLELALAALPAGLYERYALEAGELVRARTIVLADGTARGVKRTLGIRDGTSNITDGTSN